MSDLNTLSDLATKLQGFQKELDASNKTLQNSLHNLSKNPNLDPDDRIQAQNEYYRTLSSYERDYQILNDQYKEIISQFSQAYLEMSDFYVGPELPRPHFLSSSKDLSQLYLCFLFAGFITLYDDIKQNDNDKDKV